jgi:hypothetical protein
MQDFADAAESAGQRDQDGEGLPGARPVGRPEQAARKAQAGVRREPLQDEVRWELRGELRLPGRAAESVATPQPVFPRLRLGAMTKKEADQQDGWAGAVRADR